MDLVPAGFRGEGQGQCPSRLQQQRHSDALLLSAVGKLHDARDSCLQYITSRHSSVDSSRVTLVVFDGWTLLSFSRQQAGPQNNSCQFLPQVLCIEYNIISRKYSWLICYIGRKYHQSQMGGSFLDILDVDSQTGSSKFVVRSFRGSLCNTLPVLGRLVEN